MLAIIVTDGKRGHENQSRALAHFLGADSLTLNVSGIHQPTESIIRLVLYPFPPSVIPLPLRSLLLHLYFPRPELERVLQSASKPADPRATLLVISAGTLTSIPGMLISNRLNAPHVHLLGHSLVPCSRFGALLVPSHDVRARRRVPRNLITFPLAISSTDEGELKRCINNLELRSGKSWDNLQGKNFVSMLIGGENSYFSMEPDLILEAFRVALSTLQKIDARLLLTTSRRTPLAVEEVLKAEIRDNVHLIETVVWGRSDLFNPVPGFLELSKVVIVTEDSISMISEAILAGHTPVVVQLPKKRRRSKFEYFAGYVRDNGLARFCENVQLERSIIEVASAFKKRSAKEVRAELGLDEVVSNLLEVLGMSKFGVSSTS